MRRTSIGVADLASDAPTGSAVPAPRRSARTVIVITALLVAAALLTTASTAFTLQPASSLYAGFRPAALAWDRGEGADVVETGNTVRVSERFLLLQVGRAFLAAPWLLPDAGASRTRRAPPLGGWAFPSQSPDEGEVPAEEDEGVMLAESASVLATQRLEAAQPRQVGGAPWDGLGGQEPEGWQPDAHDATSSNGEWHGEDDRPADDFEAAELADEQEREASDDAEPFSDGGGSSTTGMVSESPSSEETTEADPIDTVAAVPTARGLIADRQAVRLVVVRYAGDDDSSADHASGAAVRHLSLCHKRSDWLCVVMAPASRRSVQFEWLPLVPGSLTNATRSAQHRANRSPPSMPSPPPSMPPLRTAGGATATGSNATHPGSGRTGPPPPPAVMMEDGARWFALRALRNGRLVQVAPDGDAESWVVRARGRPLDGSVDEDGTLEVSALELWREDGDGLRNLGTGALLNFRGGADPEGDGTSVRAHGDTKPRRAAQRRTRFTHFALGNATVRATGGRTTWRTSQGAKRAAVPYDVDIS